MLVFRGTIYSVEGETPRNARTSSMSWKAGDTVVAGTKPAPPLAISQEQSGIALDDLIGKQPELVGREGV